MLLLAAWPLPATALPYDDLLTEIEATRADYARRWRRARDHVARRAVEREAAAQVPRIVERLFATWLGTRWGLGAPQTRLPLIGKINCGTFVGRVLRDAGFHVAVRRLQRQPAEDIIRTFSSKSSVRRFRNSTMRQFLAGVRELGDGLHLIGLDMHVGFLRVEGQAVRFVHADFYGGVVVDEAAASAPAILDSRYRVVGRLLAPSMVRSWLAGRRIPVVGRW